MREGEVGKFPLSLFVSPSLCQLLSRSFLLPLFFKESENSRLAFCVVKNESGEKREREEGGRSGSKGVFFHFFFSFSLEKKKKASLFNLASSLSFSLTLSRIDPRLLIGI